MKMTDNLSKSVQASCENQQVLWLLFQWRNFPPVKVTHHSNLPHCKPEHEEGVCVLPPWYSVTPTSLKPHNEMITCQTPSASQSGLNGGVLLTVRLSVRPLMTWVCHIDASLYSLFISLNKMDFMLLNFLSSVFHLFLKVLVSSGIFL